MAGLTKNPGGGAGAVVLQQPHRNLPRGRRSRGGGVTVGGRVLVRPPIRLGGAELATKGAQRWEARHLFMLTFRRLEPEAWHWLRDEVLPLVRDGRADEARRLVAEWCQAWNLTETWCVDEVYGCLRAWAAIPGLADKLAVASIGPEVPIQRERPELPPWDPASETWAEYRARAAEALEAYRGRVEALVGGFGLERTPVRRNLQAFVWLVLRVVRGMTCEAVADMLSDGAGYPDPNLIAKSTRALAGLVGVNPPTKPGRPRKNP